MQTKFLLLIHSELTQYNKCRLAMHKTLKCYAMIRHVNCQKQKRFMHNESNLISIMKLRLSIFLC